jgi:hypothetical protein
MGEKKVYCFVDETGQDTQGRLFIVSVVVPEDKDGLLAYVEDVEVRSGKEKFKWGKADPDKRLQYLTELLTQKKYQFKVCFSINKKTREYRSLTVFTIAKSIRSFKNFSQYKFVIIVDALGESDRRFFGSQLRDLGVPSKKVKGVKRDESNALIRLADSMCGFIRDVVEDNDKRLVKLYEEAIKEKVLVEV